MEGENLTSGTSQPRFESPHHLTAELNKLLALRYVLCPLHPCPLVHCSLTVYGKRSGPSRQQEAGGTLSASSKRASRLNERDALLLSARTCLKTEKYFGGGNSIDLTERGTGLRSEWLAGWINNEKMKNRGRRT